jgi:hypothetical protein
MSLSTLRERLVGMRRRLGRVRVRGVQVV